MTEIYFVRHGQASWGARNYDQLSPLGWQQSRWLGEHFAALGVSFDRAIVGGLTRHQETLAGICEGLPSRPPTTIDTGLDEFGFRPLMSLYLETAHAGQALAGELPTDAEGLFRVLRQVMVAWMSGDLDAAIATADAAAGAVSETWVGFNARVAGALARARTGPRGERVLIVSSGGPKSVAMKQVLGLDDSAVVELMMQIRNTSITRFVCTDDRIGLAGFNGLPHLERPDRLRAITLV